MSELESLFAAVVPNSDAPSSGEKSSRRASVGGKSDKVHLVSFALHFYTTCFCYLNISFQLLILLLLDFINFIDCYFSSSRSSLLLWNFQIS